MGKREKNWNYPRPISRGSTYNHKRLYLTAKRWMCGFLQDGFKRLQT